MGDTDKQYLCEGLQMEDLDDIFRYLDADKSGSVNIAQFCQGILNKVVEEADTESRTEADRMRKEMCAVRSRLQDLSWQTRLSVKVSGMAELLRDMMDNTPAWATAISERDMCPPQTHGVTDKSMATRLHSPPNVSKKLSRRGKQQEDSMKSPRVSGPKVNEDDRTELIRSPRSTSKISVNVPVEESRKSRAATIRASISPLPSEAPPSSPRSPQNVGMRKASIANNLQSQVSTRESLFRKEDSSPERMLKSPSYVMRALDFKARDNPSVDDSPKLELTLFGEHASTLETSSIDELVDRPPKLSSTLVDDNMLSNLVCNRQESVGKTMSSPAPGLFERLTSTQDSSARGVAPQRSITPGSPRVTAKDNSDNSPSLPLPHYCLKDPCPNPYLAQECGAENEPSSMASSSRPQSPSSSPSVEFHSTVTDTFVDVEWTTEDNVCVQQAESHLSTVSSGIDFSSQSKPVPVRKSSFAGVGEMVSQNSGDMGRCCKAF